jgi:hypothetical protein
MLKATLIGGAAFGFLAGLPIIGALNCACCALVVAGGFLAAFLYSKECSAAGVEFRSGSGALVGLVAGLFYAGTAAVVGGVINLVSPFDPEEAIATMEQYGMPPENIDMAMRVAEFFTGVTGIILLFFFWLLVAAVFSTIGGLIGGAVFKVEPPPAPTAGQAPPPPPGVTPTE